MLFSGPSQNCTTNMTMVGEGLFLGHTRVVQGSSSSTSVLPKELARDTAEWCDCRDAALCSRGAFALAAVSRARAGLLWRGAGWAVVTGAAVMAGVVDRAGTAAGAGDVPGGRGLSGINSTCWVDRTGARCSAASNQPSDGGCWLCKDKRGSAMCYSCEGQGKRIFKNPNQEDVDNT